MYFAREWLCTQRKTRACQQNRRRREDTWLWSLQVCFARKALPPSLAELSFGKSVCHKYVWGTSCSGFVVEEGVGGDQRLTEWSHLWLLRHRNHAAGYGQFSCQLGVSKFTKWWIRHIQMRQKSVDGNQLAKVGHTHTKVRTWSVKV